MAKSLRSPQKKSKNISSVKSPRHVAVVIDLEYALPWHQDSYDGIMRFAKERGWRCSLDLYAIGIDGDDSSISYDGVIGRIPVEVAKRVARLGVPQVGLTPYAESNTPHDNTDIPGVYLDRHKVIQMTVEHLASCGYPRLVLIHSVGYDSALLIATLEESAESHGLETIEPFVFPHDFEKEVESYAAALRALNAWLKTIPKPIGLVVHRTTHARLVAHACLCQGIRIPHEVGIITPTGDRLMVLSSSPTISGVEIDCFRQAYRAAAMLERLMNGEQLETTKVLFPPKELVMRESTDVFLCEDELVSSAMRHIADQVRGEYSVDQLAEHLSVSRWTLHRKFTDVLGRTPGEEITRLRILYLKRLLGQSEESIAEIAHRSGFVSPSYFSRYFKRGSGFTPSAYREFIQASNTRANGMRRA
jgi:LacI family transcriptional regulator